MSPRLITAAIALTLTVASPAAAACFADYKAKRDAPLQLHYGVIELPDRACSREAAAAEVQARIGRDGWELLTVVSVFDDGGLDSRRESAGGFFLRY